MPKGEPNQTCDQCGQKLWYQISTYRGITNTCYSRSSRCIDCLGLELRTAYRGRARKVKSDNEKQSVPGSLASASGAEFVPSTPFVRSSISIADSADLLGTASKEPEPTIDNIEVLEGDLRDIDFPGNSSPTLSRKREFQGTVFIYNLGHTERDQLQSTSTGTACVSTRMLTFNGLRLCRISSFIDGAAMS